MAARWPAARSTGAFSTFPASLGLGLWPHPEHLLAASRMVYLDVGETELGDVSLRYALYRPVTVGAPWSR